MEKCECCKHRNAEVTFAFHTVESWKLCTNCSEFVEQIIDVAKHLIRYYLRMTYTDDLCRLSGSV